MRDQVVALARFGMHAMYGDVLDVLVHEALIVMVHAHDRVELIHELLDATRALARPYAHALAVLEIAVGRCVWTCLMHELDELWVELVHAKDGAGS